MQISNMCDTIVKKMWDKSNDPEKFEEFIGWLVGWFNSGYGH